MHREQRLMDNQQPLLKIAPARPEPVAESFGERGRGMIGGQAARLSAWIHQYLYSDDFRDRARRRPEAFTRQRKVGFIGIVSIILNRVCKTTQVELDDYLERMHPEGEPMTYTKQSFAEARQNLRPEALTGLSDVLIQGYYADGDDARYRGFR